MRIAAENHATVSEAVPTVTLAGREWPVPVLAPKQNRIVVPALLEVVPKLVLAREAGGGNLDILARYFDTATHDRLTEIAWQALTRAHPELTRATFDEMPIGVFELIGALATIAHQAGLLDPLKS
ncbi:MAG TPA: hypothetical protein VII49_02800 [Rhizomicrobium sp.]